MSTTTATILSPALSLYTMSELPTEPSATLEMVAQDFSNYFVKIAARASTTWENFAKQFCVSADFLKATNGHLQTLARGAEVFVPVAQDRLELGVMAMLVPQNFNLTYISQMTGLTVEQLAQFNDIENPNLIYAGATLLMPLDTTNHPEIERAQNWQMLMDDPNWQAQLMPLARGIAQTWSEHPENRAALQDAVENGRDPMTVSITHAGQKMSFGDFLIEFFGKAIPRGASKLWADICANPEIIALVVGIVVLAVIALPASITTAIFWITLVLTLGSLGATTANGFEAWQNGDAQALEDASTEFGITAISLLCMAPAAKASYPALKAALTTYSQSRSVFAAWSTFSQLTNTAEGAAGIVAKLKQIPGTIAHSPDEIAAFSPVLKKLLVLEAQTAQLSPDTNKPKTQIQLSDGQMYWTLYGDQPDDSATLWHAVATLRTVENLTGDGDCCYMKISSGQPQIGDAVSQWVPTVQPEARIAKIFPVPGHVGHYLFTFTTA